MWNLALNDPMEYSSKLTSHHAEISAFGGMFLLLVFLNFILDEEKEIHWLGLIEEKLGLLGKIETISIFIAMICLLLSLSLVPLENKLAVLLAGIWGILIYVGVDIVGVILEKKEEDPSLVDVIKREV